MATSTQSLWLCLNPQTIPPGNSFDPLPINYPITSGGIISGALFSMGHLIAMKADAILHTVRKSRRNAIIFKKNKVRGIRSKTVDSDIESGIRPDAFDRSGQRQERAAFHKQRNL